MKRPPPTARPTSWWLSALRRRAERLHQHDDEPLPPLTFDSALERRAAIKFFNAAFRAEESGIRQAHELAGPYDTKKRVSVQIVGNPVRLRTFIMH